MEVTGSYADKKYCTDSYILASCFVSSNSLLFLLKLLRF